MCSRFTALKTYFSKTYLTGHMDIGRDLSFISCVTGKKFPDDAWEDNDPDYGSDGGPCVTISFGGNYGDYGEGGEGGEGGKEFEGAQVSDDSDSISVQKVDCSAEDEEYNYICEVSETSMSLCK